MTATIISYTLDDAALKWCERHGRKRSASMSDADTKNSRNMMTHRPPWYRHYIGVIGELAYSWFSKQPVDVKTIGRGDDGTDFPSGVQVKASDLGHEPALMFLKTQWQRKQAKVYVLAWVQLTTPVKRVSLLGWLTREDIELLCELKDYGKGETMVVDAKHLKPVETMTA